MSEQAYLFDAPPSVPVTGIVPRDYQLAGVETAGKILGGTTTRLLLVLATGGGKTILATLVALRARAKGRRVLFVAPRREIIAQAFWTFVRAGVPERDVGVVMADGTIPHAITRQAYAARRPLASVQVASIQTLSRRALPKADVVFLDEAHHAVSPTYKAVTAHYQDAGARIVGLTATPCRGDGRGLGDVFEKLHVVASFADLAAEGHLMVPRVFTVPPPDLSGVKTTAGDYQQDQLAAACDKRELVGNVIEHWLRHAEGRTTACFAASVEHSKHLVEAFVAAGVRAEHLDCETPTADRDAILGRLASGETQVVSNMGVLTEGWDLPRCGCVVIARPTKSMGLYLQMAGRGLRPYEGQAKVLLDHAGAVLEHGFPQDEREWSLEGKKRKPKGKVALKDCPRCFGANPAAAHACTYCGYLFGGGANTAAGRTLTEREGELVELSRADLRKLPAGLRQLRQRIQALATARDEERGWEPGTTNRDLVRRFRKRRAEMTPDELEDVLRYLQTLAAARHGRDILAAQGAPLHFEVPEVPEVPEVAGW